MNPYNKLVSDAKKNVRLKIEIIPLRYDVLDIRIRDR
jgi:hypothetical protein